MIRRLGKGGRRPFILVVNGDGDNIYISHYKEKELMVMVISLIKFRQWLISLRFDSVRRTFLRIFFPQKRRNFPEFVCGQNLPGN